MEDIPLDPVVMYYLNLCTEKNEAFSEMRLRLALSQLLSRNHVFTYGNLKMYERVFVLYYSFIGRTVEQIIEIMEPVLKPDVVQSYLETENRNKIIKEWRQFQKQNLIDVVYKEAAAEMLQEWHYRCLLQQQKNGGDKVDLTLNDVQVELEHILEFLFWDMRNRQKFTSTMWRFLKDESTIKQPLRNGEPKCLSLDCASLFEAVKKQLSPWLVDMVQRGVRQCTGPLRPVMPVSQFVQLKRLPNGSTTAESESSSAKKCNTSKTRIIVEVEEPANYQPEAVAEVEERVNFKPLVAAPVEEKPIIIKPLIASPMEKKPITIISARMDESLYFKPEKPVVVDQESDQGTYFKPLTTSQMDLLRDTLTNLKPLSTPKAKKEEFQPLSSTQLELLRDSQRENINSPTFKISSPALVVPNDDDFEKVKYENVIDLRTALKFIDQLKTYSLANQCFDALDPLEQAESCFLSGARKRR